MRTRDRDGLGLNDIKTANACDRWARSGREEWDPRAFPPGVGSADPNDRGRCHSPVHSKSMTLGSIAVVLGSYLLGSVDFAVLIARAKGLDIYSKGSGNPGASNVYRSIGKKAGMTVLGLDLLKGLLAALVGAAVGGPTLGAAAGLTAVAGHCYPVFHHFRGGKGAATLSGVMFALYPVATAVLLVVFIVLIVTTHIAAIGSIVVTLAAVPGAWLTGGRGWALVWVGAAVALVLYRHRGNFARLLRGIERKVVEE
ncbi:MAG TPA: glycerol-3-phosphate acyltransferase [Actinobacteria bacterium]|nr:glycerol-3-phosphate acyltransferase [Actinomycetota bacterium]HDL49168.1 glycerol-3-phosphate acyltransferase [Actinomycetota bacterium]